MPTPKLIEFDDSSITGIDPPAENKTFQNAYQSLLAEDPSDSPEDLLHRQQATQALEALRKEAAEETSDSQILPETLPIRSKASLRSKKGGEERRDISTLIILLAIMVAFFVFVHVLEWIIEQILMCGLGFVLARTLWEVGRWLREEIRGGKDRGWTEKK